MKSIILLLCFIVIITDDDFQQSVKFGSFKITHINDGQVSIEAKALYPDSTTAFWDKHKDLLDENKKISLPFGGFLIESGNKKILMDLGLGPEKTNLKGVGWAQGGLYLKNLKKAGVDPEDINDVFFSHLHQDNIGWATTKRKGKYELTFPKANYWVNKYEWDSFVKKLEKNEDKEMKKQLEQRFYEPIKNVIQFAEEKKEFTPGLYAITAAGHSPGLTILKLEVGYKALWFTSDIFHTIAEFDDIMLFTDLDHSKFAKETRTIILQEFCRRINFIANARFGKYVFGKLHDNHRVLEWEPCKTKECRMNFDGDNISFEEDL